MKNITEEEKNLWLSNSQPKELKIELTPDEDTINYIKNSYVMPCGMQIDSSGCPTMGTISYKSDGSALVTNNSSNLRIYHSPIQGLAGTLTISAEYKDVSGEQHHQFQLSFHMSDGTTIHTDSESKQKTIPYKDGWDICYYTFSVPSGCTAVTVWFRSGADVTKYTHSYYIRRPQLIVGNDVAKPFALTNSDIVSESLEITQILESGKTLSFGDVNASSLKFRCRNLTQDVRGWFLNANLKLKDYPQYALNIFDGKLDTQSNQTHEDVTTTITAYDHIKTAFALDMTDWWKNVQMADNQPFSAYVDLITRKLSSDCGLAQFDGSSLAKMANLNQIIPKKPDLISDYSGLSGEMFLKWIAQVCNVYITLVNGRLVAVRLPEMKEGLRPHIGLRPHKGLYPSAGRFDLSVPESSYISATYEPYKTEKIDQVIITDKGNIGEWKYPNIEGDGKNIFFIDGNPFLWAMSDAQSAAQTIYDRIKNVYFTPCNVKCYGTVFMELGDVIRVSTVKNVILSYILKRTMKGINSITDSFTNKSEQYQSSHTPSYSEISNDNGKSILKIQADIVEINELVAEKASISQLESAEARIGTLETDSLTAKNINAATFTLDQGHISGLTVMQANVESLCANALTADNIDSKTFTLGSGHIGNLDASKITSGTISTARLSSSVVTSSNISTQTLSASQITGALSNATEGSITIGTGRFANLGIFDGSGYRKLGITKLHYGTADYNFITAGGYI